MVDMSVDLGFLKLRNPVLTASGTFGYGLEFEPYLDLNKPGGIIVKGLYLEPREGNPPPRIAETPAGMINSIGLQGVGVKVFAAEILPRLRKLETAVIVNVCGCSDDEYAAVATFLDRQEGIAAYELNVSCPNIEKDGWCPAMSAEATHEVVRRVKSAVRRPVITKLSPNVTNIAEIAAAAEEAGSDAISLVNTFLAMAVDVETRKPKIGAVLGGLSGPAIKPIALRMVWQVASAVGVPVIGIGGISSGADALEYMIAGASAVQVGTANLVEPGAAGRIVDEIAAWCDAHGISSIREIIGTIETG